MRTLVVVGGSMAAVLFACNDPQKATGVSRPASGPGFYDADLAAPAVALVPSRLAGAVTAVDARRGTPRFVWTHDGPPPSVLVTAAHRRRGAQGAPAVAALWHLERNAERWQLDTEALDGVEVAHVHDVGRGAIVVKLGQRVSGIEVVRTSLSVIMTRDLELVALSGGLHAAAKPSHAKLRAASRLAARDALARAFDDVGAARGAFAAMPERGGYQRYAANNLVVPARVKHVLYPVGTQLVPAWLTEIAVRGRRIAGYRHAFAADDGRLLHRAELTQDTAFSYRVWADASGDRRPQDGPQGDYTPHPAGAPNNLDPAFVAPALIAIDGFNTAPGGGSDPWLPNGATTTLGNNVDAYADLDPIDGFSAGDIRATTTSPGVFDRTYNPSLEPLASPNQTMASVTSLFYVNNWLHDYFYDSGFTESAGNAQAQNFGRGGVGGDVLHVEAQDSSGTDNANMFTPGDGESPRMQMYLFTAPMGGPMRDGTLDNHIVTHEWGHYLHHRLVDCGSFECASMSEGWADFVALMLTMRATDNLDGTWGMGAYPLRAYTANAAYFGIRRYPYSTDLTKSPLTLAFVESGVPLPSGPPFSDVDFLQGSDNWEVHNSGEIWCLMHWEALIDMLKVSKQAMPRFTFDQGRRRYADYIVGGMIAAPVEPTYTEQRDAILATVVAGDAQDFVLIASAYARRGFGSGAVSPPVNSFDGSGVAESFVVTGTLDVTAIVVEEDPAACDNDGILDVGETGLVKVTVRNVGAATLAGPTISASGSTAAGVAFPSGASTTLASIAPFASRTGQIAIRLDEVSSAPASIMLQIGVTDASAALPSIARQATVFVNRDITPNASAIESFEAPQLVWTTSGWTRELDPQSSHVAIVRVAASGDHTLQTPGLQVGAAGSLTLSFIHRHAFSLGGPGPGALADGGVIEISTNGTTWADIATVVDPGYTGSLGGNGNPLGTRMAYAATNPSFPDFDLKSLDLGTSFANQMVFLRFRAGGDTQASPSQWEVDQVAIGGLVNTPFPLVAAETSDCLPGSRPIAVAPDVVVSSGDSGMLDATGSSDPDGGALTYQWMQTSGIILDLSSYTVAQPLFQAPVTDYTRVARYQLVVRDPDNRVSDPIEVKVTINPIIMPDAPPDAAPPDAPPDAPAMPDAAMPDAGTEPDAPGNPIEGGGGGCGCATGGDPRTGGLLVLVLALLLRRRR